MLQNRLWYDWRRWVDGDDGDDDGDDGDDDEDDDDYNLPSKMFFSIKQSVSILFSFTMLLLFMFGTFAFFIISLDLFCSNIAGPSLIEINEKLLAQEWKKLVEGPV